MIIPILKPILFIDKAIRSALGTILSKPQLTNFIWLLSKAPQERLFDQPYQG
jgi:hypothetical protein